MEEDGLTADVARDADSCDRQPGRPRVMLSQTAVSAGGMDLAFATEKVDQPTDWQFSEAEHILVVHRGGRLHTMDVEFERGPCGPALPRNGDIWVIPAGNRYAALAHGRSTVSFCQIRIPTAALGDHDLTATVRHRDPFLFHLAGRMARCANREDPLARMLSESLAETLRRHLVTGLTGLTRPRRSTQPPAAWSRRDAARVTEYLEDNFGSGEAGLGLSNAADQLGMTVGQFRSTFTSTFGMTPYQHLLERRFNRAKHLLATTTLPVATVGRMSGFGTASHFSTSFRARTGVTPSQYRRQL